MFRADYKHFEKEFRTKYKVFYFSLVDRGSVVKITEWRKTMTFSIKLDLRGIDWLREAVYNILRQNPEDEFKRFYRTHNYRVILETTRNRAGRFMKLCKIQNGSLNYLFIPEEINWQGWRNFAASLDSFFATKQVQKKGISDSKKVEKALNGKDWRRSMTQKEEGFKSHKLSWLGNDQQKRSWRTAVVVYRNTVH